MNILIITPFYKHDRNIASVRWTNIGIRLAKKHNVIVVTQPHDDMDMNMTIERDEDNILVARINQKTWYEKTAIKHFGGATGDDWQTSAGTGEPVQVNDNFLRKLKNRLLYSSMKSKAKSYANHIIKNVIPKDTRIDVIISSACPFIEMLFGYELKKRVCCKWISDFRDLPFVEDNCDDTHIQKRIMQKVLTDADAIITIANKGKETLLSEMIVDNPEKVYVIRNGFSLSDARETTTIQDDKLHIVHTGSLYGGLSRADLLFQAISTIKTNNPNFQYILRCAGGNNQSLIETSKKYLEESNVCDMGFVPREDALKMQNEADILLVIVRDKPGSIAAKIYEYMLVHKPVVCVTCDKNKGISEESELVKTLNLGIAIEENDGQAAIDELADYLLQQWQRKAEHKELLYTPNVERIKEFDHDNIVIKIECLCETLFEFH